MRISIYLVLLAVIACTPVNVKDYQQVSLSEASYRQAQSALTREFFDPESARFRDPYVAKTTLAKGEETLNVKVLCGYVNGKNRLGGYVGFKPYAVVFQDDRIIKTQVEGTLADCRRIGYPY